MGSLRGAPALRDTWCADHDVIVATLRALLRASSRSDAAAVLQGAVVSLGGEVVPAAETVASDLPVDVSLGVSTPLVVRPPDDESARRFLGSHLPSLVEDATWAAVRCDTHQRESVRATIDDLTRVASRAEIGPRLGLAAPGDSVCVLDLDHLKALNDAHGHSAGDATLRDFGSLLLDHVREADFVGRFGGDEFLVVLSDAPAEVAALRMRLLADRRDASASGTTVSVGIATVDSRGGALAATAADRALYRAKRSGRALVELAVPEDYESLS